MHKCTSRAADLAGYLATRFHLCARGQGHAVIYKDHTSHCSLLSYFTAHIKSLKGLDQLCWTNIQYMGLEPEVLIQFSFFPYSGKLLLNVGFVLCWFSRRVAAGLAFLKPPIWSEGHWAKAVQPEFLNKASRSCFAWSNFLVLSPPLARNLFNYLFLFWRSL